MHRMSHMIEQTSDSVMMWLTLCGVWQHAICATKYNTLPR